MGVRYLKPVTPGSRFASRSDFSEITTEKPEKSLTVALRKKGGRNNTGRITVRRRGGGHKRRYRIIDYKRNKFGIVGKIATIEYDPNRSAYISLVHYEDGEKRYILSPLDIAIGTEILSGDKVPLKTGNALKLVNIPTGLFVHNIELVPVKRRANGSCCWGLRSSNGSRQWLYYFETSFRGSKIGVKSLYGDDWSNRE